MTQDKTPRPVARKLDLVTREMPDEMLVYDLKTHQAHCLNQTAATVWKYCNGKNSVTDIAELLALETSTAVDEAATWLAIERLGKANLLEVRVTPPVETSRLGRREVMRRMGLGAAIAVPLVISVVAPVAALAASCIPLTQLGCGVSAASCCTTAQNAPAIACQTNKCCLNSTVISTCTAANCCTGVCQNVNKCT